MKEKPIIFSTSMVQAILHGRKTQTRRIVKLKLNKDGEFLHANNHDLAHKEIIEFRQQTGRWFGLSGYSTLAYSNCPYGDIGDRLWVREALIESFEKGKGTVTRYAADGADLCYGWDYHVRKRPSIHMPRWASRINLEITSIRVERLQDISEIDALAEGVSDNMGIRFQSGDDTPIGMYAELWESIHGQGSWDANHWVWAIEFKTVSV